MLSARGPLGKSTPGVMVLLSFTLFAVGLKLRAISLASAHMRLGDMVYSDPIIIHLSLYSRSIATQLSSKPVAVSPFPASAAA